MGEEKKISVETLLEYLKTRPLVIFDTETTGFRGNKDHLLSFSAIKVLYKNGTFTEQDRIDQFFDPEVYIPKDITEINHISNETVKGCPTEEECYDYIQAFIGNDSILCGYNVGFDIRFMTAVYKRLGYQFSYDSSFDVLMFAKEICKNNTPDHKLATMVGFYDIGNDLKFHNSIDDVIATCRLLEVLLKKYPEVHQQAVEKQKNKFKDIPARPVIQSVQLWEKSDKRRVYVNTKEVRGIYYDLITKNWFIPEGIDVNYIRIEAWRILNTQTNAAEIKAAMEA